MRACKFNSFPFHFHLGVFLHLYVWLSAPSPNLPDSSGWNNQWLSRGDSEVTQIRWENRRWCARWVARSNLAAAHSPLPITTLTVLNKSRWLEVFFFFFFSLFLSLAALALMCFWSNDWCGPPRPLSVWEALGSDKTGMLFVWCRYNAHCAITGKSLLLENVHIYICRGGSDTSPYFQQ